MSFSVSEGWPCTRYRKPFQPPEVFAKAFNSLKLSVALDLD